MNDTLLHVAALQLDIKWADTDANLAAVEAQLASVPACTDLLVLPEMFSTGFVCDPAEAHRVAQTTGQTTMKAVTRWAREGNHAVCGSFIAREGDSLRNRAFFVEPSGKTTFYDKRHLFMMGGEHNVYTPGTERMPIVDYRGWKVALAVCYDLRFPAWLRNVDNGYDLIVIVANWPDARALAWNTLLTARAIENQAYVIGCNRSGCDAYGCYSGHSTIIDPKGQPIVATPAPTLITATLSLDSLKRFRSKFPVHLSADRFTIE